MESTNSKDNWVPRPLQQVIYSAKGNRQTTLNVCSACAARFHRILRTYHGDAPSMTGVGEGPLLSLDPTRRFGGMKALWWPETAGETLEARYRFGGVTRWIAGYNYTIHGGTLQSGLPVWWDGPRCPIHYDVQRGDLFRAFWHAHGNVTVTTLDGWSCDPPESR